MRWDEDAALLAILYMMASLLFGGVILIVVLATIKYPILLPLMALGFIVWLLIYLVLLRYNKC